MCVSEIELGLEWGSQRPGCCVSDYLGTWEEMQMSRLQLEILGQEIWTGSEDSC